ncbi:GNAT family N-acetyltransferase [Paenibacillus lautus]|uniref:GNAT family N-acetyltransferase n=1 Tax=Paenibacillus lautus TaxID=1401 RepID=UPI003D2D64DD
MIIRRMTNEDLNDIIEIWLSASKEAHHFIPVDYWESKQRDMREVYLPMAETYLIESAAHVRGFVSLVGDDLAALFIDTSRQNQGYGKALLSYVMDLREVLKLRVYEENQRAIRFYLKNGFEVYEDSLDHDTGQKEQILIWSKNKVKRKDSMTASIFQHIDTVFVPTRNIKAAKEWYTGVLGGKIGWESEQGEYQCILFGQTSLTLFSTEEEKYFERKHAMFNFFVPNVEDAYRHLKEHNVRVDTIQEYGATYFTFYDLDDNCLEICSY